MKKFLYSATIFISAFLLFQIQPMIAKIILPWFGGAASVWVTAVLFFQSVLLAGYLYSHWAVRSLNPKTQAVVHVFLLGASLLLLPIALPPSWKPTGSEDPIIHILGLLTVSIGLPYFLLSATSPLLQAWYARKFQASLPYRLFGLSNLASLLGLLAYPLLVEPTLTLQQQSHGWSAAFVLFVALCSSAAIISRSAAPYSAAQHADKIEMAAYRPPRIKEQAIWLLLAGCASSLMLSVTNHITQNVASIPFLWIVPLSIYLLTFILCFDYEWVYRRKIFSWLTTLSLAVMTYGLVAWNAYTNLKLVIPAFSSGLFICCMFCHGELVKRKPDPRYLTSFYLMLSLGGVLGGLFVGLLAPKVLSGYFELPYALIVCSILSLFVLPSWRWRAAGIACLIVVTTMGYSYISAFRESARVMKRNFYGGLRVQDSDVGTTSEARTLIHGTINHGKQFMATDRRREHIAYYGPDSGVGLAIGALRSSPLRAGIIGLGAGALASYAEPGDVFRFYEINPLVETLARTEFTYLSDAPCKVDVVTGDGRLSLEREQDQHYDLLVVDAFSGDSIPVHLLTQQAMNLYFRHLKPTGILAINITNRHLDLSPVVEQLSLSLGKRAALIENASNKDDTVYRSQWVLIAAAPSLSSDIKKASKTFPSRADLRLWTDDYNNLFRILR